MCGITVVDRLEIECYAAQHLSRDNWVVMEYVWRWEDLHGLEEEFCPTRPFPRRLFVSKYLAEGNDKEEMCVPQSCPFSCDMAVGFGIKLMKTLVEVVVVEEVKNLTAVEFDHADEILRVVETRQGQGRLVLGRIRWRGGAHQAIPIIPPQIVGAAIKEHHGWWQWGVV
jgi:hypothetical protein